MRKKVLHSLLMIGSGLLIPALLAQPPVSTPAPDRQILRWSGQVGGEERILVRGEQVQLIHDKLPAAVFDSYYMTAPLPSQRIKLKIRKLRGRGKVKLLQKPQPKNGYTAVVLVKDGKRGVDDYEFELSWKGSAEGFLAAAAVPPPPVSPPKTAPPDTVAAAPAKRTIEFIWPLKGDILSRFGAPRGSRRHQGLDIRGSRGANVIAARSGSVVYSGSGMRGYGKTIIIDHGGGLRTLYAHNSQLLVRTGQRVRQGQTIARVGRTGRATTDHCHFEIRRGRKAVDPLPYLQ